MGILGSKKVSDMRKFNHSWEGCILAQKGNDIDAMNVSGYDKECEILHRKVYSPIGNYFKTERLKSGLSYKNISTYINRDNALYLRWEEGYSLPNREDYRKCQTLFNGHLRTEYEELRTEYEELRTEYEELRTEYEELRRPFKIYDNRMKTDIWKYNVVNGYINKHPCEKPISIMKHIVGTSSKHAQTILDPFMGSGTTGVACVKMGRKFTGIELDEDYFEIACKRISDAYAQPDMFVETEKPKPIVQESMF